MPERIRIGISSCLLGLKVRYDGGDKRDADLLESFGPGVEWVPVCPEFEMGLGVPREPIQLVRSDAGGPRLLGVRSEADHTDAMRAYAKKRLDVLAAMDLCGYVLKSDSPSCGLSNVPVFGVRGSRTASGSGLFAAALVERFPDLPVEEESRLADAGVRERFIERVFAYARPGRLK